MNYKDANKLKDTIKMYWANRGVDIDVRVVLVDPEDRLDPHHSQAIGAYTIESDLTNGVPPQVLKDKDAAKLFPNQVVWARAA